MQPESFLVSQRLVDFQQRVKWGESLVIEELWESPKALLAAIAMQSFEKHIVFLTAGQKEDRLLEDLGFFFDGPLVEFPAWETLPGEEISPSSDIVGERYRILNAIANSTRPHIIIANLQAILQKLLPPKKLSELHLMLKKGSIMNFESMPHLLHQMGYHRKAVAADKAEFAVRGGIIDIFPVASTEPVRIEFFDDQIESLRIYDPISQVSIKKIEEIAITPGEELELLQKEGVLATLFDYLGPNTLVVFDEIAALEDRYVSLQEMTTRASKIFCSMNEMLEITAGLQKIFITENSLEELSEVAYQKKKDRNYYSQNAPAEDVAFSIFGQTFLAKRFRHPFLTLFNAFCPPDHPSEQLTGEELLLNISRLSPECNEITLLTANEAEEKHFHKMLEELQIQLPERHHFAKGYLSSGFYLIDSKQVLLPMTELTHRYKIRRQKQRTNFNSPVSENLALNPGEAVVHLNSGIGKFLGIEKRPNHIGIDTEFMLLEYADNAKLYVPIQQANLISKYIGADDSPPRLHPLGSNRWKLAREKTQQAIIGYASDLLKLHAERAIKEGFIYPSDSEQIALFAQEFPYIETIDQQEAIKAIASDMCSNRVMDRLICGDVGYGKTEVAMRAAFKAVVDGGKQVAILVPTTVLALQHYETLCDRMQHFPVNIEVLSRFRTAKQIKTALEGLENGSVDIVVGTLRMISEDVHFKNLGLVIIDEEQRFGVRSKEHLKKLKKEVDCLTLSATPIPRTLYMSLVGAREMSLINTPPQDRLPIKSSVCQFDEQLIKNALLRELARDGQAYFIHNRVETIFQTADKLRTLLPSARIIVGHGQMSASELDHVFHSFKTGQADILVATSIVENGIDIPLANTILVDRADRFGIAELYQIRGRVGRWSRKAYCYFLIPNMRELPELARKRLSALADSSGHGGGMKIAMHDLEIRGAGNILGTEQSGHISAIGFHLYCKLLRKTIQSLQKKGQLPVQSEVKMEFPYDARLPEDYINEMSLRMEIYQRLGDAETEKELIDIINEVKDRFGPIPEQVQWLYYLSRIRLFASYNQFTQLKLTNVLLIVEQQHGKKSITKKIIFTPPKTAPELENKVIETLKANFPLKTQKI